MKLLIIVLIKLCSYSTHTTKFLIAEVAVTEKRRVVGICESAVSHSYPRPL